MLVQNKETNERVYLRWEMKELQQMKKEEQTINTGCTELLLWIPNIEKDIFSVSSFSNNIYKLTGIIIFAKIIFLNIEINTSPIKLLVYEKNNLLSFVCQYLDILFDCFIDRTKAIIIGK